jgi:hypothetical protein
VVIEGGYRWQPLCTHGVTGRTMSVQEVTGRIETLQEQRFRLVTRTGQALLLTLAHDAPLDAADLERWHRAGTSVSVRYSGAPNHVSGTAHTIAAGGESS